MTPKWLLLPLLHFCATSAAAQTRTVAIRPHPSSVVWAPSSPTGSTPAPNLISAGKTGLGIPTGAYIGAAGGLLLAAFYCGFRGGDSGSENCGAGPYLVGIFAGGVTGALIDGAFRD